MSTNISKQKREDLLAKIGELRTHIARSQNDENKGNLLTYLSELEKEVKFKKYGLIFEEHREEIDEILLENIPVLAEATDLFINNGGQMNFLIEGDNLAALRLLLKTHREKIDLIYIDPPYNTFETGFMYDDTLVDKNIRNISIDLNTSLNNMVFIDDNQVERDIVRTSIADICIPEIKSVEEYIHDVDIHGYFEAATISDDDLKRNEYYKNNIKRQNNIKKYESYEEYLLSLDMECIIMKINDRNIQRVLQLINKTNQFNLTTKRYTINELQSFINDSNTISFCASLQDKFGDNGVVSTLLAKTSGQTAIIELWIMSCRVFNRDLEYVVFSEFVRECEKNGISSIEGIYIPTEKNKYVENLYKNLGFSLIQENNNSNTSKWRYNLNNQYEGKSNKMRVI